MAVARRRDCWERASEILAALYNGPSLRKDDRPWKADDFNRWPRPKEAVAIPAKVLSGSEFIDFLRGKR